MMRHFTWFIIAVSASLTGITTTLVETWRKMGDFNSSYGITLTEPPPADLLDYVLLVVMLGSLAMGFLGLWKMHKTELE